MTHSFEVSADDTQIPADNPVDDSQIPADDASYDPQLPDDSTEESSESDDEDEEPKESHPGTRTEAASSLTALTESLLLAATSDARESRDETICLHRHRI